MDEEQQKMWAVLKEWIPTNPYQLESLVEFMYQFNIENYEMINLSSINDNDLNTASRRLKCCNQFIIDEINRRAQEEKEHDQMVRDIQNTY